MKNFTLTIKDNKTNETVIEERVNIIMGGYSCEEMSGGFCAGKANPIEIASAIVKARKEAEFIISENPMVEMAVKMIEMSEGSGDDDEK